MKTALAILCGVLVMTAAPIVVLAEPITFEWSAVVTQIEGDPETIGAGPIKVGDPFGGTFTYDPVVPPNFAGDGYLIFDDEPASVTVDINSFRLRRTGFGIVPSDGILWQDQGGFEVGLQFGHSFPGFALPTAEELLASFDPNTARAWLIEEVEDEAVLAYVHADFTHLSIADAHAPIPEPATLLLVGPAVLFLKKVQSGRRARTWKSYTIPRQILFSKIGTAADQPQRSAYTNRHAGVIGSLQDAWRRASSPTLLEHLDGLSALPLVRLTALETHAAAWRQGMAQNLW